MHEELSLFHTSPRADRRSSSMIGRQPRPDEPTQSSHRWMRVGFWMSFVALPLAAGVAYATAPSRRTRRSRTGLAAAGTAFGLGLLRWQLDGRFSREPAHQTEKRVGRLEVRRYAPMVVAETTLAGADWDEALQTGFRRLAGYISGKNAARARIELTAPAHFTQHDRNGGERLAMTAPVAVAERAGGHTITFVLPEGRTLESLPVPLDTRIQLRQLPARRVAVLRFSGAYTWEPVRAKMRELLRHVERVGWETEGDVHFGGYDPPWTLPVLRRNEVWVELASNETAIV
jgi:hypothetical protein